MKNQACLELPIHSAHLRHNRRFLYKRMQRGRDGFAPVCSIAEETTQGVNLSWVPERSAFHVWSVDEIWGMRYIWSLNFKFLTLYRQM
jgi:hypothetical protein